MRHKYSTDELPFILANTLADNPKVKKNVDSVIYSDEVIDEKPFQRIINDPDTEESLNDCFKELKASTDPKWRDLADYYIAFRYIIGAVDNAFSMEQNHDFGIDLMLKLASIGNSFAQTYLKTMLI